MFQLESDLEGRGRKKCESFRWNQKISSKERISWWERIGGWSTTCRMVGNCFKERLGLSEKGFKRGSRDFSEKK